jgi:hypothetical protein
LAGLLVGCSFLTGSLAWATGLAGGGAPLVLVAGTRATAGLATGVSVAAGLAVGGLLTLMVVICIDAPCFLLVIVRLTGAVSGVVGLPAAPVLPTTWVGLAPECVEMLTPPVGRFATACPEPGKDGLVLRPVDAPVCIGECMRLAVERIELDGDDFETALGGRT